jgi:hypothetical protein
MVFLFKRFRKKEKGDGDAPAKGPSGPVEKSPETPPQDQPSGAPAPEPQPEPRTPEPEPAPSSPPPPLPIAAPAAVPVTAVSPTAECFICGTPLEGRHCPKCQMTWDE